MEQELKGSDLMFTALIMLMGVEGVDWSPYEGDEMWWKTRMFIRRN